MVGTLLSRNEETEKVTRDLRVTYPSRTSPSVTRGILLVVDVSGFSSSGSRSSPPVLPYSPVDLVRSGLPAWSSILT